MQSTIDQGRAEKRASGVRVVCACTRGSLAGMIAKSYCIYCGDGFHYPWKSRRRTTCPGCVQVRQKLKPQHHRKFWDFFGSMRRWFQNPIYQTKMLDLQN